MPPLEIPFLTERRQLNAKSRADAAGSFIKLMDGCTHYQLGGPADGEIVVLVHGFSVPFFIWDPVFEALTQAGFRVLRYDLFGRGYSDRPRLVYGRDLFDRQLLELLAALNISVPISILGLSMGGVISSTFADRHPRQVAKLGMIDPAGFKMKYSTTFKLYLVPGLGKLVINLVGKKSLEDGVASDFYNPKFIRQFLRQYRPQMEIKGFRRAIISTLRSGILEDNQETFRRIGQSDLPVLLVWGTEDYTVPFSHSQSLQEWIPQVQFHPIENSGHLPHYERPALVNPILIQFLQS